MAAIETEGLTKYYGEQRGIEDVTIAVEEGEVFGFLGPNGAGKTTTIRTLLDLLHPTRGSARVFGLDSRRDSVAIRRRLGNLPGDFGYGKRPTGREALALLARLRGTDGLGRAEQLAERFHADLDRPLGELSRGNRQKVGLILALFHSPDLLVLDEPTSGLDPLMQEEFLALLHEERRRGCAVFLSSHELDEVERVCDRVGIIRDGRVIAGRADVRPARQDAAPRLGRVRRPGRAGGGAGDAGGRRRRVRPPQLGGGLPHLLPPQRGGRAGMIALLAAQLGERRRAIFAWALPLGLMSAFIVAIYPSVEDALAEAIRSYPQALKEAFGIGELANVEQYLEAEMLSLIVPLAAGYLAVRSVAGGLSGAAESGRLDVLLSAPVSRSRLVAAGFAATAVELAAVLTLSLLLTAAGSRLSGAGLSLGAALAGFANVWPLALLFAGLGIVVTGFSLRTSVVTGSVAAVLVAMYVADLIGRLDPSLDWVRYASVFRYYGSAIEDGIDPLTFCGVTAVAIALAALGAALFERRDLSR